ncbi:hypothetical protein QN366_09435 [Pseudomonas sp. CCC3.2]|uniref:hypothetical protein n=1 Tax=unclassified Pseudomonas TaxID=196821 RepID=UPI002AB32E92|nr:MULTISPECIES: hypothetical protein [unclassified Pseudomonas]MDY7562413.1 hypothetical protein [Pseudomonas sp. AB6]MEB0180289.1 hypothetical protein [Pseudomonas sp. CCC3.2]MEB0212380.1 hypothetical protein [Pseudomonas sp. AB6]
MQPVNSASDIEPDEAFQLVFRELKNHEDTGRRNFVVRVPVDFFEYLISGILRKSGLSKVVLEQLLTERGILKEADGRVLRRHLSGQTRIAWETYQRLLFWALGKEWVTGWAFHDLLLKSYLREAAQLSARKILNTLKRRTSSPDLTREQLVECFSEMYLLKRREREETALSRTRTDTNTRELARSLGLKLMD